MNNDRIDFPLGRQKDFIIKVQDKLNASVDDLASIANVHPRTVRDWRREKFFMSVVAGRALSATSHVSLPKNLKTKKAFWYTSAGGKIGGPAVVKKYGRVPVDSDFRKKRWQAWWEKDGKHNLHAKFKPLPFSAPKPSEELAEFFGIMMGDGGMNQRQISITLHNIDDLEYSYFARKLIKKLFNIEPSISHREKLSVNVLVISRSGLVKYLHSLGLVIGNKIKQEVDIPQWIKNDNRFSKACIRGLVDTDGCIFTHKYKVNNKWYSYKKIDFTSASTPLRESVSGVLKDLGMTSSEYRRNVRLNSKHDVERYFKLVGSHNPKHLKKYHN